MYPVNNREELMVSLYYAKITVYKTADENHFRKHHVTQNSNLNLSRLTKKIRNQTSGVTTAPADPAKLQCSGARGPRGPTRLP